MDWDGLVQTQSAFELCTTSFIQWFGAITVISQVLLLILDSASPYKAALKNILTETIT